MKLGTTSPRSSRHKTTTTHPVRGNCTDTARGFWVAEWLHRAGHPKLLIAKIPGKGLVYNNNRQAAVCEDSTRKCKVIQKAISTLTSRAANTGSRCMRNKRFPPSLIFCVYVLLILTSIIHVFVSLFVFMLILFLLFALDITFL